MLREYMDTTDLKNWMRASYEIATASPDPSTQNGAILLNPSGSRIGVGCNNFPAGVSGSYWTGEKADKYARVCHAEVSAIMDAAMQGHATADSTLVCAWAACSNCAKYMARAGVTELVRHTFTDNVAYLNHWREDCLIGDEIFAAAGVKIVEIEPVAWEGALRRDGKTWTPSTPLS